MRQLVMFSLLMATGVLWSQPPVTLAYHEFGLFYDQGKGLDKDVAEEIARRVGVDLDAKVLVRARIWKDLESGDLDATVSGIETPERAKFAWFIPYMAFKNYAIVPKLLTVRGATFEGFLADKSLRFGVVASFKHSPMQEVWISQLRALGRVEESADTDVLFRKLSEGRVQGLFSSMPVYKLYLGLPPLVENFEVVDWSPDDKGLTGGLVLSRKRFSEADYHRWRGAVEAMHADGTLKAIFLRYTSAAETARALDF